MITCKSQPFDSLWHHNFFFFFYRFDIQILSLRTCFRSPPSRRKSSVNSFTSTFCCCTMSLECNRIAYVTIGSELFLPLTFQKPKKFLTILLFRHVYQRNLTRFQLKLNKMWFETLRIFSAEIQWHVVVLCFCMCLSWLICLVFITRTVSII